MSKASEKTCVWLTKLIILPHLSSIHAILWLCHNHFQIDSSLHYIIHSMVDNSSANVKSLNGSSMLCRHMAMRHPLLMMRYTLKNAYVYMSGNQRAICTLYCWFYWFYHCFYRHLSLIGSLLKGKLSLAPRKLQKNVLLVFNNCFHILELLQPMLFNIVSWILSSRFGTCNLKAYMY